jgi:ubiquinone/menaquinone biosynthesis C-methylase UbiE
MRMSSKHDLFLKAIFAILQDLDCSPNQDDRIVDLGCGKGDAVESLSSKGFRNVIGVDINQERIGFAKQNAKNGNVDNYRLITNNPYKFPISSNSVDLVFSGQVLEHVKDMNVLFLELKRVMHKNAVWIHIFPPKFRLLETHTQLPFGNIINYYLWHRIFIFLKICKVKKNSQSVEEYVRKKMKYIDEKTFYRLEKEISSIAMSNGLSAKFLHSLKYSENLKFLHFIKSTRLANLAYGIFVSKVLLLTHDDFTGCGVSSC